MHQYQHQILNHWGPKDGGHGRAEAWTEAVRDFSTRLGITSAEQVGAL